MRFEFCIAVLAVAAAAFISNDALALAVDGATATGRSRTLLQAGMKVCPVDLAAANYTVLTSRCRWPQFDPRRCCAAFTDLACPYADYLNDNSTDCAVTIFQHIRFYGNYPPGVFYLNCKAGPEGLKCPDDPVASPSSPPGSSPRWNKLQNEKIMNV
ncbi:unnamed protein product [Alopecurus aequalis]